jgi:hypothetical protein
MFQWKKILYRHFISGVRESYVNLCSNVDDKLKIYRENFERAYIQATESFYKIQVWNVGSIDD